MRFRDKTVFITGASSGMGEALAKQLAQKHCKLALFARREEHLKKIAKELTQQNTSCIYQACDVSDPQQIKTAVSFTKEHYGHIDVAILAAGILVPNPIETYDSTIIKKSLDINFMGAVYAIEHILPIMKQQKQGTIAAVSTLPDRRGVAGWGAYGASKAALSWMMESLRAEAKQKYNIDIITIKPGSVQTPMIDGYHRKGAITPEEAATLIINGIEKNKKIIQFPFIQVLMTRVTDLYPVSVYDYLPLDLLKGEGYPDVQEKKQE